MNTEEAIERFKEDFYQKGSSQTTWETDYWKILKRLDPKTTPTAEDLHHLVCNTQPNSKTRRRAVMVVGSFAKFAGIEYDPNPYKGKYSPLRLKPRDIPTDEQIVEYFITLTNPGYRWIFGMMAAYGLRNHETVHCDMSLLKESPTLWVLEGKTGERRVKPLHPEWYEQFELYKPLLPNINLKRRNDFIGHSITRYFSDLKNPPSFKLYSLRHAYAIRGLRYGLQTKITAKMMGHSVLVHEGIYHLWIDEYVIEEAYSSAIKRAGKPTAPPFPTISGT
jgi:integrase